MKHLQVASDRVIDPRPFLHHSLLVTLQVVAKVVQLVMACIFQKLNMLFMTLIQSWFLGFKCNFSWKLGRVL